MATNYVFLMAVPDLDHAVEYRTDADSHETAIDRAYSKYPTGEITSVVSHNARGWDIDPPEGEGDDEADDTESDGDDTAEYVAVDPTTLTISELKDVVGDASDEELAKTLELEQANDDRNGAVEVIEGALE